MVADGERQYIEELQGDHFGIAQVSVNGGESSLVAVPFANSFVTDIATDGSALLVASFKGTEGPASLWTVPLPTGSPQRLNDSSGEAAAWSGDRSIIVFAHGPDVYAANGNGCRSRDLSPP